MTRPTLGLLFCSALAVSACGSSSDTALQAAAQAGAALPSPDDDTVVAVVAGQEIRMRDLEAHWQERDPASFTQMRQQVYEANRNVLDDLIGTRLLEAEAARRSITIDELIEEEVASRIVPLTDAEMRELYAQSQEAQQGVSFEELRPAIANYLTQQQPIQARLQYINELREAAGGVEIRLAAPRAVIEIADTDPVKGSDSAVIEIVEFSDFQCPYCRQAAPVLMRVLEEYGDQVRLVWKDFPLPSHPDARPAAEAARCAQDQGKFWEFHDRLFDNQRALTPDNFSLWAAELGMDGTAFASCVEAATHRQRVAAGEQLGNRYAVSSTPTVFVNGRLVLGAVPYETYEAVIEEELAAARR